MFLGFIILWFSKKKLSKNFIFISSWLLATLFAVTLSERPYPHYLVQSVGPISILLGILLTNKTLEQSLTVIPLALAFFVPFYYKFWYYPTTSYYERFVNFTLGKTDKLTYFNSFSPNLNTNYKIAKFLSESAQKNESVFVWSNDSAAIYSLSKRLPPFKYVADYHISDFSSKEEIVKLLAEKKPKFIVVTENSASFSELYKFLNQKYYIISEIDSSQIWLYLNK